MHDSIAIHSPVTGQRVGEIPRLSPAEVQACVARARAAQPAWAARPIAERAALFAAAAQAIDAHAAELRDLVFAETGKPRALLDGELASVRAKFEWLGSPAASAILASREERHGPALVSVTEHVPHGVAAAITPWNFPLTVAVGMFAPLLLAGNAVVLKPSELTPLSLQALVRRLHEIGIPPDVLVLATGDGATGRALVEAPVDMVSFTGSNATGEAILRSLADRTIPRVLEMGGKGAFVVLADADPVAAAETCVAGAFGNCGQMCHAVERAYVHRSLHDAFVAGALAATKKIRLHAPGADGPADYDLGPFIDPRLRDRVHGQITQAVTEGARLLVGGHPLPGPGNFYAPAILTGVTQSMPLMREETFGPVLPIMPFDTDEEAVALANDTRFGLAASVFAGDAARASDVASRILAGTVWINLAPVVKPATPWGGFRQSGIGRVMGPEGLLAGVASKVIYRPT